MKYGSTVINSDDFPMGDHQHKINDENVFIADFHLCWERLSFNGF